MKIFAKAVTVILSLTLLFTSAAFAAPDGETPDDQDEFRVMSAKVGTKSNPVKTAAQLDAAFKSATSGSTIYIGAVTITMNNPIELKWSSITIKGAGQNKTVLKSPKARGRHFNRGKNLANKTTFEDITFQGPGAKKIDTSTWYGGIEGGVLTFNRCTIVSQSNYRYPSPGAAASAEQINMKDCTVRDNTGGVSAVNSLTLANCTIINNIDYMHRSAGSVVYGSKVNMKDCTIRDNLGGIYAGSGTITNCIISGNSHDSWKLRLFDGGGINIYKGTITNCIISGNKAIEGGGVIVGENVDIINCTISGNAASGNGGAVGTRQNGKANLINCTIYGNTAKKNGGGIYAANAELTNCTITANTASELGGGVYANVADIKGCIISGNTCPKGKDAFIAGAAVEDTPPTAPDYNIIGGKLTDIFAAVRNGSAVLNNNGGSTQTIMIKAGGIAHDAIPKGTAWLPSADQRNVSRPRGAGGDIGAVETTQTAVSGAKVTVPEKETIAVGASKTIMYCTTPADLKPIWYTNKPDVISVSSTGKVKGLKKGSAYVYAKVGNSVGRCTVTVK